LKSLGLVFISQHLRLDYRTVLIAKGNRVREVLSKVSTVCWTKKPQAMAKSEQKIKLPVDIISRLLNNGSIV
jgi:hypothetical protein